MNVEELMTRHVRSCRPGDSLNEAARIMWETDCGFVPVVEPEAGMRVVGVITDRDICIAAYTKGKTLREIPVRDVMAGSVRACAPDDRLAAAEEIMREAQVRRLPVVDESGRLVGILSLSDIARELARETGSSRKRVTGREVGESLAAISKPRQLPRTR
jgi:CBS domain-containing protein